jgi:WD40 repeat protein
VVYGLLALLVPAPVAGQPKPVIQFGVAFSSDTAFMGTCGDHVRVFELKTGTLLREIDSEGYTRAIAFSPVAADLFAAGGDDGILRLWHVGKKDFLREFRGHDGMITGIAFEKSGRYVASTSMRSVNGKVALGQFQLREIETGKVVQSLEVKEGWIQGVSFSGDGNRVAFCRNPSEEAGRVEVYSVQPWKLVASVKLPARAELETTEFGKAVPLGMAPLFEPNPKRLLVAGGICVRVDPRPYTFACAPTGLLWRADLAEPASARLLDEPKRGYYRSLSLSPDGKRFATGNGHPTKAEKPQIQLRDVSSGKVLWSVASDLEPFAVSMTPDGEFVATCQRDSVRLLNATTGETVRVIAAKK